MKVLFVLCAFLALCFASRHHHHHHAKHHSQDSTPEDKKPIEHLPRMNDTDWPTHMRKCPEIIREWFFDCGWSKFKSWTKNQTYIQEYRGCLCDPLKKNRTTAAYLCEKYKDEFLKTDRSEFIGERFDYYHYEFCKWDKQALVEELDWTQFSNGWIVSVSLLLTMLSLCISV